MQYSFALKCEAWCCRQTSYDLKKFNHSRLIICIPPSYGPDLCLNPRAGLFALVDTSRPVLVLVPVYCPPFSDSIGVIQDRDHRVTAVLILIHKNSLEVIQAKTFPQPTLFRKPISAVEHWQSVTK